jgi:hypothetical protein
MHQYLFHSLSSYSIKKTDEPDAPQEEKQEEEDHDPRAVRFADNDPRSVSFAEPDPRSASFAETNPRARSDGSVAFDVPPPPPVHGRGSNSRTLSSSGRLHSIAATIVHPSAWHAPRRVSRLGSRARKSSIYGVYEKAKVRGVELRRKRWVQLLFEYTFYLFLLCFVYFLLIGVPLWKGACAWLYYVVKFEFDVTAGFVVVVALAAV